MWKFLGWCERIRNNKSRIMKMIKDVSKDVMKVEVVVILVVCDYYLEFYKFDCL